MLLSHWYSTLATFFGFWARPAQTPSEGDIKPRLRHLAEPAYGWMAFEFPILPTTTLNLTAKSANVSEAGIPVRINILRWSTEEERLPMLAALNPALAPAPAAGARGGRGSGARGDDPAPDPAQAEVDAGAGGRGARGGAGGGGT
jgi:hypothetical protein